MKAAINKVEELKEDYPNHFVPQQFNNPNNPDAHRKTTANEIYDQVGDDLDIFISGVGTGGTITGVGEVLKEKISGLKVIAVEPEGSPAYQEDNLDHIRFKVLEQDSSQMFLIQMLLIVFTKLTMTSLLRP